MPETQVKLATRKQRVSFDGNQYNTCIIEGRLFFIATELRDIVGISNIQQYFEIHSRQNETCYVRGVAPGKLSPRKAVSESAVRRVALRRKRSNLIKLVETMRASYSMPIAKTTSDDLIDSVAPIEPTKPVVTPVASVDPELKRMVERLQASNDALKAMVAKLQPKPSGYVDGLQRQSKNNITAKTTAQVAADYGYSLAEFKAKLVGFGMIEDNEMIELSGSLSRQGRDILKNYPKITDEQLWTIKGQITLYELLAAKDVIPLIDKLNDIETGYNISI